MAITYLNNVSNNKHKHIQGSPIFLNFKNPLWVLKLIQSVGGSSS